MEEEVRSAVGEAEKGRWTAKTTMARKSESERKEARRRRGRRRAERAAVMANKTRIR